jgi:hypothetical protein
MFPPLGTRETRDGWPLLTAETEVNGDAKSANESGPSLVVRWARHASIRDFYPALAALVSPVQNSFFLTVHYFNSSVPIA